MAIKPIRLFLLGVTLCALSAFSACEKQSEAKLKAMTAHHHEEEHAYEDPKAEADALGKKPHATTPHGHATPQGASPSATPAAEE